MDYTLFNRRIHVSDARTDIHVLVVIECIFVDMVCTDTTGFTTQFILHELGIAQEIVAVVLVVLESLCIDDLVLRILTQMAGNPTGP